MSAEVPVVEVSLMDLHELVYDIDWTDSDDWLPEFRDAAVRLYRQVLIAGGLHIDGADELVQAALTRATDCTEGETK